MLPNYVNTDTRNPSTSRGVCQTYGGNHGISAYDLPIATMGFVDLSADAGRTDEQTIWILPENCRIFAVWNTEALSGGTISVDLPDFAGGSRNVVTLGALNAVADIIDTPLIDGEILQQRVTVTVTGGTAGEVVHLGLQVAPRTRYPG